MPAWTPRPRVPVRWLPATLLAALALVAFVLVGGLAPAGAAERPPPRFVVSVSPDHGALGSTFQATLTMTHGDCYAYDVGFYLDGAVGSGLELAPLVTMPQSCRAVATVKVPSGWRPGAKRILGTYQVPVTPRHEKAATFTVDPSKAEPTQARHNGPPPATATVTASATPAANAITAQPSASDPPSVRALAPPSPNVASDAPLRAAQVAPARDVGRGPLLWTAVIGIIMVGLFGARAAHRQGRAAAGRRAERDGAVQEPFGRHRR